MLLLISPVHVPPWFSASNLKRCSDLLDLSNHFHTLSEKNLSNIYQIDKKFVSNISIRYLELPISLIIKVSTKRNYAVEMTFMYYICI